MIRYLLPLGAAIVIVVVLGWGLTMDPRKVPSPLIDEPAPSFRLTTLANPEVEFTQARFKQHAVSLFNVWASWCVACRAESALLVRLAAQTDLTIYGLNYKDTRADARAWLARFGDPYAAIAYDPEGQVGLDWGVYGVPETFVVDGNGVIRYKHIGPITRQAWRETIRPIIRHLRGTSG